MHLNETVFKILFMKLETHGSVNVVKWECSWPTGAQNYSVIWLALGVLEFKKQKLEHEPRELIPGSSKMC